MKQAKKNWLIFTPGSLQYCSQNYCTVVPEMTVFLFAEITAFLFPVYTAIQAAKFPEVFHMSRHVIAFTCQFSVFRKSCCFHND